MRLDQWLWCVRLFRSRNLATEAIRGGRVKVDAANVKPAWIIRPGAIVVATIEGIPRTYRVIGAPPSRVGAKLVPLYAENLTPPELLVRRDLQPGQRERGAGRPTKRDRRQLDEIQDSTWSPSLEDEDET